MDGLRPWPAHDVHALASSRTTTVRNPSRAAIHHHSGFHPPRLNWFGLWRACRCRRGSRCGGRFGATRHVETIAHADAAHADELAESLTDALGADAVTVAAGVVKGEQVGPGARCHRKPGTVVVSRLGDNTEVGSRSVAASSPSSSKKRIQGSLSGASSPGSDILRQIQMYRDGKLKPDEVVTGDGSLRAGRQFPIAMHPAQESPRRPRALENHLCGGWGERQGSAAERRPAGGCARRAPRPRVWSRAESLVTQRGRPLLRTWPIWATRGPIGTLIK